MPYRFFKFSGEDAETFLQGQFSIDMSQLNSQPVPCLYCSAEGKVLGFMFAFRQQQDIIVLTNDSQPETLINRLKMFILRAKVTIEPLPWLCYPLACIGDNHPTLYNFRFNQLDYAIVEQPIEQDDANAIVAELECRHLVPQVTEQLRGQILAPFFNFDLINAISYSKGCFVGQEPIARLHFRSQPNKRMIAYQLSSGADVATNTVAALPWQVGDSIKWTNAENKPVRTQLLRCYLGTNDKPTSTAMVHLLMNVQQLATTSLSFHNDTIQIRAEPIPPPYPIMVS